MHEEQAEISKQLEVEKDDLIGAEAMHVYTIDELKKHIGEQATNEMMLQWSQSCIESVLMKTPNDKGKNLMDIVVPSFSLGLTQMELADDESKSIEAIQNTEVEKNMPRSVVAKHNRSKQDVVSPPPRSAFAKLGKNLRRYATLRIYLTTAEERWNSYPAWIN